MLVTAPPQSNEYKRTLAAYRHWVELAKQDPGGGLPQVERQLKPGDAYAGAARMRELLVLDGDLKEDAANATPEADASTVAATRSGTTRRGRRQCGTSSSTMDCRRMGRSGRQRLRR